LSHMSNAFESGFGAYRHGALLIIPRAKAVSAALCLMGFRI